MKLDLGECHIEMTGIKRKQERVGIRIVMSEIFIFKVNFS